MDVRRRACSSRGNLVPRLCIRIATYLPRTVLHAINKSYYTPLARCFFMNLSSTVRYGRRGVSIPLMVEFIHKRISLYHLRPAYVPAPSQVAALCKTRDNLKICACSWCSWENIDYKFARCVDRLKIEHDNETLYNLVSLLRSLILSEAERVLMNQ